MAINPLLNVYGFRDMKTLLSNEGNNGSEMAEKAKSLLNAMIVELTKSMPKDKSSAAAEGGNGKEYSSSELICSLYLTKY